MKRILQLTIILLTLHGMCEAQQIIRGKVISADDRLPLPGASVKLNGTSLAVTADTEGRFSLAITASDSLLTISYIGYKTKEIRLRGLTEILVALEPSPNTLREVVVSTGYQSVPRERATGSFSQVDGDLLNRTISTGVLSRLDGVVSGLVFNRNNLKNDISIRGRSTIFANSQPLIVLDNFPYEGDIENINPNDIESVSVLKDAAAASIWGSRAGNGVIVIITKKGSNNRPLQVSFSSTVTSGAKPDLFYEDRMSTADFIEMEKTLFVKGYYQSAETSINKAPLTPVVELLIAKRDGKMAAADADAQIEALKSLDVRDDFTRHLYRNSLNQQYAFNLNGGSEKQRYYVSAGYDKNLQNAVGNDYGRITLNASNTYSLLQSKLDLTTGILFTQSNSRNNNPGAGAIRFDSGNDFIYPYARLADESGSPLAITHGYRNAFIQSAESLGMLDWQYRPLDEIGVANNRASLTDYKVNAALKYRLPLDFTAEVLYQYGSGLNERTNLQSEESYYTRDMINKFTMLNSNGSLARNLPFGGILNKNQQEYTSHNFRAQLNYSRNWLAKHSVSALAGWEVRDLHTSGTSSITYGYNSENATGAIVDYLNSYSLFYNPAASSRILYGDGMSELVDRFISWYGNGLYAYKSRYTFSASARLDQSNLFGVETNQKGVPLWSAGMKWNVAREDFYNLKWLPELAVRATYGYNGNIDKSVTAYTTARLYGNSIITALPYARIINAPNDRLRWERVKIINGAIDFETRNGILSGSIEYYRKQGKDLIGNAPLAPTAGMETFRGNTANTQGEGWDVALHSRNIDKEFQWGTTLLFSHATDKVTGYSERSTVNNYMRYGSGSGNRNLIYPLEGRPLYAIYSYRWAGLDPQTGNPQGYADGQVSRDYTAIINGSTPDNVVYHGSARPLVFGALRNTFSWKRFSVSANISYRLGYYFRRQSVDYSRVLAGEGGHGDYSRRWQKPGDEDITSVPSLPAVSNVNRDNLYLFSEALVEKGDHIRLQDINISYDLKKADIPSLPFSKARLFLYAGNLGMIWQANDAGLDPDYLAGPPPRTIAAGLRVDF
ncbi:MAG TPA: SusC/RagA family TonB-linked outer membrane protein [Sphingobacteriaceae bacterium]